MAQTRPAGPVSSAWPRTASVLLALALVGAAAYIVQLRSRVAELETRLATTASRPAAAAAPAAAAPAATAVPPANIFTAEKRQAMLDTLRDEKDPNRKVWFLVPQNNVDAAGTLAALQAVFREAGWPSEVQRWPSPLKAGLFLLAADTEPPGFVSTVNDALTAGGLDAQYLTGYREFFTDRKKTPGWVGPELADAQAFTIAIGSRPR